MQTPPPPPPPSSGPPPMMPPPGGSAMAAPAGNLASPGLRIVGGLIDVIILSVVGGIISLILKDVRWLAYIIVIAIDIGYFAYFWSSRGQSVGMMAFGFKVRDIATGHYPTLGKAALRPATLISAYAFTISTAPAI